MRERETTSKTELRFNCHVEASLFIYLFMSPFFALSSVEALQSMKIGVSECGSLKCVDCVWTGFSICSNAVSSLHLSPASNKCCVE